jgi:hypothetical protein
MQKKTGEPFRENSAKDVLPSPTVAPIERKSFIRPGVRGRDECAVLGIAFGFPACFLITTDFLQHNSLLKAG